MRPVAVLLVAICLAGCQSRGGTPPQAAPGKSAPGDTTAAALLACPAPPGSAEPNLTSAGDRLYLSWLTHREEGHALHYAVLQRERWTEVRTIVAGDSFFANWADFPSLAELADGSLVAHWLWRSGPDTYAYDVLVSRSRDGLGWSAGTRPHRDGTQTEHGFVSIVPDAQGGATLAWIDGRDYAGKEHDSAEMRLMGATLTAEGFLAERVLDPRVCDCCQTGAVRTPRGALVAYRDRSSDEVRDISLVRCEDGVWTAPYPLAADGWQLAGCPVNGPALAADGERVAAAWFTLANQQPTVNLALSNDAGRTFPVRVRVDDGDPLGRADVVFLQQGEAVVVWMESGSGENAAIRARRVHADGGMEPSFTVAATSADRASGFPRLERLGNELYCAWTETGEPSQVRLAALTVPSSSPAAATGRVAP